MIPKILIINAGFWTATSGGCTHLFEVGIRLQNKGIHVDYIIPTDAEYGDYMNQINNIKAFDPEVIGKGKDCKGFLAISYLYWKRQRAIIKYMKEHKEDMKQYNKKYQEDNRDKLKEYNKQYNNNNIEHITEQKKKYYELNKEKIREYQGQKIECECGGHYTLNHKLRHFKSKKHINSMEKK